jgi:hypothetical protein
MIFKVIISQPQAESDSTTQALHATLSSGDQGLHLRMFARFDTTHASAVNTSGASKCLFHGRCAMGGYESLKRRLWCEFEYHINLDPI